MSDARAVLTGQLRPVEHCSRCGAGFVCGYVAGLPACWCASQPLLPSRQIVPGQHCLCPACLALRRADQTPDSAPASVPDPAAG
ncbi:cysteine-rich CWC family protein [Cupriavidus sp. H39]|uniref:cysteine-rich CWC family protein n=1 Tax=Cupriavidus sp. H39 TaxID=3401635 RepID=UPI003D08F21C